MNGGGIDVDAGADAWQRTGDLSEVIHTAEAAPSHSDHVAPAPLETGEALRRDRHVDPDAGFALLNTEVQDLVGVRQYAFAYAEADGEAGEVGRR
jgi:hypothetical protein